MCWQEIRLCTNCKWTTWIKISTRPRDLATNTFFFLLLLFFFYLSIYKRQMRVATMSFGSFNWYCSYSFFFFFFSVVGLCFFFFLLNIYMSWHIYCYTNTINFTIFSQLLRCQFLIGWNKVIKYETMTNHDWK